MTTDNPKERDAQMLAPVYVSYETAKLLKQAGFPQHIKLTQFFTPTGQDWHFGDGYWGNGYARPTQEQALRWLRQATDVVTEIQTDSTGEQYYPYCWRFGYGAICNLDGGVTTTSYEEAAEIVILAAAQFITNER